MVTLASHALFAWPSQAAVARPVAKAKIYAHAKPTAALRALFVEQVETQWKITGLQPFSGSNQRACLLNFKRLVNRQLEMRDGNLLVPKGTGLGFEFEFEFDDDAVSRYAMGDGWVSCH